MLLAQVLGFVWIVEQPGSSCFRDHVRFQFLLRVLEAFDVKAAWAEFKRECSAVSGGLHVWLASWLGFVGLGVEVCGMFRVKQRDVGTTG